MPKRSSERRRRNKESKPETIAAAVSKVKRPRVSSHWHPIAKQWFRSLGESGQSELYEPSDWQAARLYAELITRALKADRLSAQMFAVIQAGMTDLLTTEAARRRVRLEIDRGDQPEAAAAGVTALNDYRRKLGA